MVSDKEQCPTCKCWRFGNLTHVCPPKWNCKDEHDCDHVAYAQDAEDAAEAAAEKCYEGEPFDHAITVSVCKDGEETWRHFFVEPQYDVYFSSSEIKPKAT